MKTCEGCVYMAVVSRRDVLGHLGDDAFLGGHYNANVCCYRPPETGVERPLADFACSKYKPEAVSLYEDVE